MSLAQILKQPAEALQYLLIADIGGGEVLDVIGVGRGLVSGAAPIGVTGAVVDGTCIVSVTGGTDGERYLVTARAQRIDGTVVEGELEIAVVDGMWAMPDGGVPYLTIAEFVDLFGLEESIRMTDATGAGRIDRALLVSALRAAQGIADGNLAARYAVPIATVPALVKTAIADIARARLYPRGAPEGVATAAKDAVRVLERIASGALPLPLEAGETATPAASDVPVLISAGERRYPKGQEFGW